MQFQTKIQHDPLDQKPPFPFEQSAEMQIKLEDAETKPSLGMVREERQPALANEDEPDYDDSLVILDWCKWNPSYVVPEIYQRWQS